MSEESKKSPIPNHMIIGLGGTGGRILRALRRTIYEEFREKHPVAYTRDENGKVTGKIEHPVRLGYLYVDSSPELMGQEDVSWKVPGGTLQLGSASQLLIGSGNLKTILDNIGSYPGIRPWIGDRNAWHAILDGLVGDARGGQKRRLGRFLFSISNGVATADSFNAKLQSRVAELTADGDARCVFHVCAGLAGGTGSGCVVDVVAQIRKIYPYPGTHLVVLYLMLPEANPDPAWAKANYHANGYAALVELNAMSAGCYQPYDIAGGGNRVDFSALGNAPVPAFDGCYIFSNINENNKMVGVADGQLHGVVANFLFQKIVVVDDNKWAVETLKRFEECENDDVTPERASDQPGAALLRSRRFLTFGIKRLVIPEEEIREYICYSMARQMALQSLYNNWSDNFGFTKEPRNENIVEMVRGAGARNRWKISDEHLILSAPILRHEESWKALDEEWEIVDKILAATREKEKDRRLWLSGLAGKCEEFYRKNFRGFGVEAFYKNKEADTKDQAREICRTIEADLFAEWRDGRHPVHDLLRKLEETLKMLSEIRAGCDEKIAEFKRKGGEAEERSRIAEAIELNNREWAKVGPLSDLFGKRQELLEAQAQLYKKLYAARTRARAWAYAKVLCNAVIDELARLKTSVANIVSRLLQAVEGETSRSTPTPFLGLDERIADRCRNNEKEDLQSDVVKIYDPGRVRDFTARITRDRNLQREHAEIFRKRICDKLDKRAGFFSFDQDFSLPKLFDALEAAADAIVETTHNSLVASDSSLQPVLGQNIIRGLAARFPDKMDLRNFIHRVMAESGLFLQFDKSQENLDAPGCVKGSRWNNVSVILPASSKGDAEFHAHLRALFEESKSNLQVVAGSRPNVLTILSISNLFPLRYASHVKFLQSRFEARVNSGDPQRDARARLEVFTEGDGTQFPDLFPPTAGQIKEKALPLLRLAILLGLVRRMEHHATGQDLGWHFYDDSRPHEKPEFLGMTDSEMLDNCGANFVNKLELLLASRIKGDAAPLLKKDIGAKIQEQVARVMAAHPNPTDPERISQIQSLERAKQLLDSYAA